MNDVMLPWPRPRHRKEDEPERAPSAPHYEIQRVDADGSTGPAEVLPITRPPWAAASGRRGLLGAGIASTVAAALLLSACDDDGGSTPPASPSPSRSAPSAAPRPEAPSTRSPSPSPTPTPTPSTPTYDPPDPTYDPPDPTYDPPDPPYGGGGGVICTCNKVCTCIPVCQAHRLLDPDPVVRRMAEVVVLAMGRRELPYLRWAADRAPDPLRRRVEEFARKVRAGHRLGDDELTDPGCDPSLYLSSDDPVVALMAAQVLTLRALTAGTGLTGPTAEQAARALVTGRILHRERAPAWRRARPAGGAGR